MDVNQIQKENRTIKIELNEIKNQTRFLFKIYLKIFDSDEMKRSLVVVPKAAIRRRMAFGDGKDDHYEL
jgi:hypothetical protein